jgi:hypothetical protein
MNGLKKILGILWIAIAVVVGYFGITVLGIPRLLQENRKIWFSESSFCLC